MITHILSKQKPEPIKKDPRGILIEKDIRVCFNRSGDIILGKIIELKKSDWIKSRRGLDDQFWWNVKFELIVQAEDGKLSTVKNPNSFIII